jgi:potassium uptake TrkH family protein
VRSGSALAARPAQVIAGAFAATIAVGTAALSTPLATASGVSAPFIDALFTATSAVCVTGLVTVDTGSYWSGFGQVVILGLIQVGGLGVMTVATVISILFFRRLGLQSRLVAQAETKSLTADDLRAILRRIILFSLCAEAVLALILAVRFATAYGSPLGEAAYSGVFHAISAFNNAGFGLYPDSLVRFSTDAWILLPISVAVIVGGLGFPVVMELAREWRNPRRWSALTRVTVVMTASLLAGATVFFAVAEARNSATWGDRTGAQQALASFVTAVMPRTAGFNAVDLTAMRPESLVLTDLLMFIGGGSAGTAGGMKVTTLGVLLFAVAAELRGQPDVVIGRRRISADTQRQALSVTVLGTAAVAVATTAMLALTDLEFETAAFEVVSAFGTVGLSLGVTASLPDAALYLLVLLMFAGRLGPLTFASALAARDKVRLHRRPEERMPIG